MQPTNVIYKLLPSLINVALTFALSLPLALLFHFGLTWKLGWILIFFLYNFVSELSFKKRDPGMLLIGTDYERQRSPSQKVIYVALYTVSFSTLLFHVFFIPDLLLANLLLLQLPCILLTGNTVHGYLSGNVRSVIRKSRVVK